MTTDNATLLNKLTLLVLSLILVCLVMLVIRAYQKPLSPEEPSALAEAAPASVEEAPEVPASIRTLPLPPSRRLVTTNTVQAAPPRAPRPVPTPDAAASASPAPALPNTTPEAVAGPADVAFIPGPATDGAAGAKPVLFGTVTLVGKPKPEIPIDLGPTCGALHSRPVTTRHYVVSPSGGLANVLVYLKNAAPARALTGPPPLLDQIGCMFEPYILGVVAGQRFRIRNSDPTLHNIHATPQLNREFNLGQGSRGQVTDRSFSTPELFVRLKCDVHPWMFAYVNVLSHPFFAITDTNGFFRLPAGFPAGTHTVSAIHLKTGGEIAQEVTLAEGEQRALTFQFTVPPAAPSQGGVARSD